MSIPFGEKIALRKLMLYDSPMAEPAEKTRRRWFQFHLSTAVVLMIAAAGLLWVNVVKHFAITATGLRIYSLLYWYGWPIRFLEEMPDGSHQIFWPALVVDLAAGLSILFVVAYVCEFIARRKRNG